MNPLFLLLLGDSAGPGTKLMRRILPATLPGQTGLALAVLSAKQDIRSEEQADKDRLQASMEIIKEVVNIDEISDAAALKNKFPKLHRLFISLPEDMQNSIFRAETTGGRSARKPSGPST
jgi:hypothetical protein